MNIGDKIKYLNSETGRHRTGKLHGIRRAADDTGKEGIISYVVDTGSPNVDYPDQPELVDVKPGDVEPV